jgi:hypothetical protein
MITPFDDFVWRIVNAFYRAKIKVVHVLAMHRSSTVPRAYQQFAARIAEIMINQSLQRD